MAATHPSGETTVASDTAARSAYDLTAEQLEWLDNVRTLIDHQETFATKVQRLLAESHAASSWGLLSFIAAEEHRIAEIAQALLGDPGANADVLVARRLGDLAVQLSEIGDAAKDLCSADEQRCEQDVPSPVTVRDWLRRAALSVRPLLLRLDLVQLDHAVQHVMEQNHLDEDSLVRELSARTSV